MSGSTPAVASKAVPLRPTLVRKRDDVNDLSPCSPGKRAKVTFDSDVQVRVVQEWEKAPELIQEEVRSAFQKRARGDLESYNKIKNIYGPRRIDDGDDISEMTLRNYTMALLANVSSLDKSTSDLVSIILNSNWLGRQQRYVSLFLRLLASLVSAHGYFLAEVLRMLAENLVSTPRSNRRSTNLPPVSRRVIYARAHKSMQYILQLVPSASRVLSSVLVSAFPHQTGSRRAHTVYVQNLLEILSYSPELRADVLALITERLVKIDVQVQVDLEELTEEVGEGLLHRIPKIRHDALEDAEDYASSDDESESEEEIDIEAQRTKDIMRNVEKMDAILDTLFVHYDRFFSCGSLQSQMDTIDILLSQFTTIILPTHRSRHTQFLLFHFAQQSTTYIDTFVGTCVQITFDRCQSAIVRQASAAYLASFVSRGIHVPSSIVRDVFDYLGSELERLRCDGERTCRGPNLRRYSSFYCLVQALLYIFCFRWRDLEFNANEDCNEDDSTASFGQEHQWKSGVKEVLSLNIFSKLNPLKVCSPSIVTEFARVSNHLGVVYVYHLLETNKRIRLSQFSGGASSGFSVGQPNRESALSRIKDESHQHLDEYFPFDPYHLPKSKRWIERDYREWAGIIGLDDEQGTESESDANDNISDMEEGTETD